MNYSSEWNYVLVFSGRMFPMCKSLVHVCVMQSLKGVICVADEYEIIMFICRLLSALCFRRAMNCSCYSGAFSAFVLHGVKSVWPEKLVSSTFTYHILASSACNNIFLKITLMQFCLGIWSRQVNEIQSSFKMFLRKLPFCGLGPIWCTPDFGDEMLRFIMHQPRMDEL